VAEVLAGGWYFATEVARILGAGGATLPERGAVILGELAKRPGEPVGEAG
jgi:energy-coupling factor transport system ATP-binding protein